MRELCVFARARVLTTSQLAIAWVLTKAPASTVPVLGARTRQQLDEAWPALDAQLSADDISKLEALVAASSVRGERYQAAQMAHLDSEK